MSATLLWASISAEVYKLRHRRAVWVAMALLVLLLGGLDYLLIYALFKSPPANMNLQGTNPQEFINMLYPSEFVRMGLGSLGSIGGPIALVLGVMAAGSEYGWSTPRTVFTQGPGRVTIVAGRSVAVVALALGLAVITFVTAFLSSGAVGALDGRLGTWPSPTEVAAGFGAAWLVLAMWALLGMALATLLRQSATAIGVGLGYSIAIEGLIFALVGRVGFMQTVQKFFPGANATALVEAFGRVGPGAPAAPLVGSTQAVLVLGAYLLVFVAVAATLTRRRDLVD